MAGFLMNVEKFCTGLQQNVSRLEKSLEKSQQIAMLYL
jgi:hypothetical protein